jgi:prefoldin subunit 4
MSSNLRMLEKDQEVDVDVEWEDQQHINEFSRLNTLVTDWEEKLNEKKQEKEYLEDLNTELELMDDDELIRYRIGDAFIMLSLEEARTRLENEQEKLNQEMEELSGKMSEATDRMQVLKRILYGKFGNAINLDK